MTTVSDASAAAIPRATQGAWASRYATKVTSPQRAVGTIRRGQRVFIGSGCAEPQSLVRALVERAPELADNPIIHILTLGVAPYVDVKLTDHFRHNAFFIGPNVRDAIRECRADYTPIFLSEIPRLFRSGKVPIDVALIQVSPPDEHGYCSYGVSVDVVKSAAECARFVVAEVNRRMPRALGDCFIHADRFDAVVEVDEPILETDHGKPDEVATSIGRFIADLIDDGSTLQLGIGTIPDAVLAALGDKKDLGIHTEMFAEGVIELVEKGVINGARKTIHPGKIVASFVMGGRRLFDFIDDNPMIEMHPTEYTNDPFRIAQNDRMVAINSALQVDLTGQVCADSLGAYFYSGIGGQVDFIRGASRSKDGKPIIALPSTARDGTLSRITPMLSPGAGVVTSRGDVHYVVTEYGAADLHGKTIRDRAIALIHIAHPKFRDKLMEEARRLHFVPRDQVALTGYILPQLKAYESDVTLSDGGVMHIRPLAPTDEEMMREAFYDFSEDTVYHRFFETMRSMPHGRLLEYMNIDYASDMALVAVARRGDGEMIVAVARYAMDMATNSAELALVVRDAWQHKGLGTRLFQELIRVARDRGIMKFTAEVMADNAPMLHLFHECAQGPVQSDLEDGVYHLSFQLEPAARPPAADDRV